MNELYSLRSERDGELHGWFHAVRTYTLAALRGEPSPVPMTSVAAAVRLLKPLGG